jgi:hypothetical protein
VDGPRLSATTSRRAGVASEQRGGVVSVPPPPPPPRPPPVLDRSFVIVHAKQIEGRWVSTSPATSRYDAGGRAECEASGAVPIGAHSWILNQVEDDLFSEDGASSPLELEVREMSDADAASARGDAMRALDAMRAQSVRNLAVTGFPTRVTARACPSPGM